MYCKVAMVPTVKIAFKMRAENLRDKDTFYSVKADEIQLQLLKIPPKPTETESFCCN